RLLQHGGKLGGMLHGPGLDAKGGGDRRVIGTVEVDVVIAGAESGLLTGLDPAEHAVGTHDIGDRSAAAHDGLELAAGETERAVAHHGDDLSVGPAVPGTECG